MSTENQANSFSCRSCGSVFTEESGATEGFTCEDCINDLEDNLRDVEQNKEQIINQQLDQEDLNSSGLTDSEVRDYMRKYWTFNKSEYLEFGYTDESFSDFLKTTALNTLVLWKSETKQSIMSQIWNKIKSFF